MVIRRKITLLVVITLLLFSFYFVLKSLMRHEAEVAGNWFAMFEGGNYLGAKHEAKSLVWIDGPAYAYLTARTDFAMDLVGRHKLTASDYRDILRRIKIHINSYHYTKIDFNDYLLKILVKIKLNQIKRAEFDLKNKCISLGYSSLHQCMNDLSPMESPDGSRIAAMDLYIAAEVRYLLGMGNANKALLYKAISLKYFNLDLAHLAFRKIRASPKQQLTYRSAYCGNNIPKDESFCQSFGKSE